MSPTETAVQNNVSGVTMAFSQSHSLICIIYLYLQYNLLQRELTHLLSGYILGNRFIIKVYWGVYRSGSRVVYINIDIHLSLGIY